MSNPSATEFLAALADASFSQTDRAVALLWWGELVGGRTSMSANEVAQEMVTAGYAKQNVSRLRTQLTRDRRTAKADRNTFRIRVNAFVAVEEQFGTYLNSRPLRPSDSVVPRELFEGTRGYLEKVVAQLNGSYDAGFYDCCAVMSRRLLETLIIEVYENLRRSAELKDADGHYRMLSGLVAHLEVDSTVTLSRNGVAGLREFKQLGDLSAHNRRFNARKHDIDRVRNGLRVVAEELLSLSGLA